VRPPEQSLLQALESWPGVRLAVLFGSAARGQSGPGSDLDVGVLLERGMESAAALEVALARATGRRLDLGPEVAAARVARAQAWLSDAESLLAAPPDEFVADRKGRDLALFYLFLAIQECISVAVG
jgi:predicted nucleotidyltransferase